jgi:ribosomal protection tetracycline resistance protein
VRTLNLGILAHVDAGKTSLTERLLYTAGAIGEIGRVDDGSTQTDTLTLERQRGITIKAAVVSFRVGDTTVNLIDTPGHPDFIAEVERVLTVLDGAVLVVSAVEGVQPQTRILMRTLRRLDIPALIFINKIDRCGADPARVVRAIKDKLTPRLIALGGTVRAGTKAARFTPFAPADRAFTAAIAELLADDDDEVLTAYVDGTPLPHQRLHQELTRQARHATLYPVLSGSAITGAGIAELNSAITRFLPASGGDPGMPLDGAVFKIDRALPLRGDGSQERGTPAPRTPRPPHPPIQAGGKIAYVRLFAGTLRARDRVRFGAGKKATVTTVTTSDGASVARPGQIARLTGMAAVRIGDAIRAPASAEPADRKEATHFFAPPSLETAVVPVRAADRTRLHAALALLAEQDPLINLRRAGQEIFISLFGEVQKEVIEATLADEFGIAVTFRETTTICVERPFGSGESVERINVPPNPFLAGVGLRVEAAPDIDGVRYRLGVSPGAMPPAFFKAVEETVRETLTQGLYGWRVTGCLVTMTHSGYWPRQSHAHATFDKSMSSTAGDFRSLTPLVVMDALSRAGTAVLEPLHRFVLDIPAERAAATLQALPRLDAVPLQTTTRGSSSLIEGEIPAARVRDLERELPTLTAGEGVLETSFDRYRRVHGEIPSRPRTDHNPLNRKEYLLHVARRV